MVISGWMRPASAVPLILVVLFAALVAAGCDESVDPIAGSDVPFTVWGFMNAGADTQYVRAYEVTDQLIPDTAATIDAEVFSTDLTTGERRQWTYRKVRFDSLITGHVFWSPFRAEHEHKYRLEVIRSDGAVSRAEVTVPSEVTFVINAAENSVIANVRIEGEAPNLVGPKVTYRAINVPPPTAWPPGTPVHPPVLHPVVVSYEDALRPTQDGWTLAINMITDTLHVRNAFRRNCLITPPGGSAPDVWLREIEFSFVAANSSWNPPGGVFNPDELAVPGTMSNVDNGYGFFGAGHGVRYRWTPSLEARLHAGYSADAQCTEGSGTPLPVARCMDPPIPCIGEDPLSVWQNWLR